LDDSHSAVESVDVCRNCSANVPPEAKFCAACGQRASIGMRLTMREIAHDIMHALTHADHSIFALVRGLVTRPGRVAREYIAGQRKRHFGPWAFLLISVALASAVILLTGVHWFRPYGDSPAADVLQRHVNLAILLQMPILAAACALLFPRDRLNYAEHLVLAAYTSGFHALYLAAIETPLLALTRADTADPKVAAAYFGVWAAYFAFAASQFYGGNRWWTAGKAVLAVIVNQVLTVALLMAFFHLVTRLSPH
jgi:ribosomal protein L40E